MPIVLYGIPNCDTVKKARAWLDSHAVPYRFHDFRQAGVPTEPLSRWVREPGWELLLNRRGTTWRRLDGSLRDGVLDAASATALMSAQPSVIRRPVVDWGTQTTVGFDADDWAARAGL
jgi:Spx/MgsR family transcriptional regulator